MRMHGAVVVIVACWTGCSGPSSTSVHDQTTPVVVSATSTTAPIPKLVCSGTHARLPADFSVFFDAVALPASAKYTTALQTSAQGDDPATRLFAKTGIWYRADRAFEIVVPDKLKGQLAVGWGGGPALPGPGVASNPCPGAQHDWVVLPGGYWASRTMCATLLVRADGKQQEAHIGLGEPCPGQAPPAGASDT
jgi:hypothetical protein